MPEGAEGLPEDMVNGARGMRMRKGVAGQMKGTGMGMLMREVPEAGQGQWEDVEVRAVEVRVDTSWDTCTRD